MPRALSSEPILIVEDNDNDALLLKKALQRNQVTNPIHIAPDGVEALKYLCGEPPYEDRQAYPFPSVIYSDLKMPRMDGFEVLNYLKSHPDCAIIPVIVMTASDQDQDIKKAYELGANSYIVKPDTLDELTEIVGLCIDYWKVCSKPQVPAKC
ncbi:MAG: CheY-like response regulator receiver domain protein [Pedosphaera sp.]|nr:CheY-like response regulator receiver domain protein [Pedosphaera sp.]